MGIYKILILESTLISFLSLSISLYFYSTSAVKLDEAYLLFTVSPPLLALAHHSLYFLVPWYSIDSATAYEYSLVPDEEHGRYTISVKSPKQEQSSIVTSAFNYVTLVLLTVFTGAVSISILIVALFDQMDPREEDEKQTLTKEELESLGLSFSIVNDSPTSTLQRTPSTTVLILQAVLTLVQAFMLAWMCVAAMRIARESGLEDVERLEFEDEEDK